MQTPQAQAMAMAQQSEKALIGCAFRSPDCIAELTVKPEHFRGYKHQELWRSILNVYQRLGTIDVEVVGVDLHQRKLLQTEITAPEILEFSDMMPSAVNATVYEKQLLDFNAAYQLSLIAKEFARDTDDFTADPDDMIAKIEQRLIEIRNRESTAEIVPISKHFTEALKLIAARRNRSANSECVSTGYIDLDLQTGGGLHRGEVTIIAGRPSMGKSALAMNIAENAAVDEGCKVLVVSLEMSGVNLAERMLARAGKVRSSLIRSGMVSPEEIDQLTDAVCRVGASKLFVAEIRQITLTKIASLCRRLKMREGLDLVVIDYLQLMQHEDRRMPRQEQVADLSRRAKLLAMDLKISVVLLSQLNRDSEKRADNRPRLADLRESGAIEQDADAAFLLYRPEYYGVKDCDGIAEVDVAKQRNGPVGIVKLVFNKDYTAFENKAAEWQTADQMLNDFPDSTGGAFQ